MYFFVFIAKLQIVDAEIDTVVLFGITDAGKRLLLSWRFKWICFLVVESWKTNGPEPRRGNSIATTLQHRYTIRIPMSNVTGERC